MRWVGGMRRVHWVRRVFAARTRRGHAGRRHLGGTRSCRTRSCRTRSCRTLRRTGARVLARCGRRTGRHGLAGRRRRPCRRARTGGRRARPVRCAVMRGPGRCRANRVPWRGRGPEDVVRGALQRCRQRSGGSRRTHPGQQYAGDPGAGQPAPAPSPRASARGKLGRGGLGGSEVRERLLLAGQLARRRVTGRSREKFCERRRVGELPGQVPLISPPCLVPPRAVHINSFSVSG
jgi:hypothetical protein